MKRFLVSLAVLLSCWLLAWQVAARWPVSPAVTQVLPGGAADLLNLEIAPREQALSFARFRQQGQTGLLLVSRIDSGRVEGVDLQQALPGSADDPIRLFEHYGYERLEALQGPVRSVAMADLVLPFLGTANQVAVGINYPEHGEESAVSESFLFPKLTQATDFQAGVPAAPGLLDYEIELGFVLLQDLPPGAMPHYIGLVLASDYTDRAELLRHVRLTDVSSGDGFTQGKSRPGYMPIGNLLVIPRNYRTFYPELQLALWHNGAKRQLARPVEMSWDFPRMVQETFARAGRRWVWDNGVARLPLVDGRIPARTLFLSGTSSGVIYHKPGVRQLFLGVSELFFTLQWNDLQGLVEPFIREELSSGRYLKPGDRVVMRAERLGMINNIVMPHEAVD